MVRPNALLELYRSGYMLVQGRRELASEIELDATGFVPSVADPDVRAEQERVNRQPMNAAILVNRLVKNYTAASHGKRVIKRAVNELCLCIEEGEVFGLRESVG